MRGQIELPALGIAFLLLTATVFFGVTVASDALSSAERSPLERQAALSLSEQLTAENSPITVRENVLNEEGLADLSEANVREEFDLSDDVDFEITLGGETILSTGRGQAGGHGTTVDRIVLVENRTPVTVQPDYDETRETTLPLRTYNATATLDPPPGTTIRSVHANDRIILHRGGGLTGEFDLDISPLETTTLWFEAAGNLPEDSIVVDYEVGEARKAMLTVTVYE